MRLYTSFEGADGIIVLLDALGIKGNMESKEPCGSFEYLGSIARRIY